MTNKASQKSFVKKRLSELNSELFKIQEELKIVKSVCGFWENTLEEKIDSLEQRISDLNACLQKLSSEKAVNAVR